MTSQITATLPGNVRNVFSQKIGHLPTKQPQQSVSGELQNVRHRTFSDIFSRQV